MDHAKSLAGTVEPQGAYDDEGVRILLLGSEPEVREGLEQIYRHLSDRVVGWLRKQFPRARPEDLADAWGSTLEAVLDACRRGRFDGDRPLMPWLCDIAHNKAVDQIRDRVRRAKGMDVVAEKLRGTRLGEKWNAATVAERVEVMKLIREAIDLLPPRQRQVFRTFVDHYPESRSHEFLLEQTSKETGEPLTMAIVKRALQEARRKVREFLDGKGYAWGKGGIA